MAQVQVFARADRCGAGTFDLAHGVDILGRHRLFQPEQVELLEVARQADGARHIQARVHIHRHRHVFTSGARGHIHQFQHTLVLPLVGSVVEQILGPPAAAPPVASIRAKVNINLQGREAACNNILNNSLDLSKIHARLDLAVGIDANGIAEFAAHEFVDWHAQRLTLEVPQRNLNARQRGNQRAAGAAIEHIAAPQPFKDRIDLEWVAPNQLAAQLVNDCKRLVAAVYTLAQASDPFVRLDPHPQMHAVAGAGRRLDRRDLHAVIPFAPKRERHSAHMPGNGDARL